MGVLGPGDLPGDITAFLSLALHQSHFTVPQMAHRLGL